jgi:hypothetical protein
MNVPVTAKLEGWITPNMELLAEFLFNVAINFAYSHFSLDERGYFLQDGC